MMVAYPEAALQITYGERLRGFAAPALRDAESSAPLYGASGSASPTWKTLSDMLSAIWS